MEFYNVKKKVFSNSYQFIVYDAPIMKGFVSPFKGQKSVKYDYEHANLQDIIKRINRSKKNSQRRTKNMIYDIARSNVWDWFITLTFNPDKVNSFNYNDVTKKLSNWFHYMREVSPGLKYIVVPEFHKSGRIHFHGLLANVDNMQFIDSGYITNKGDIIYNMGNYRLGFTTATKVKDTKMVAIYITKYISKELTSLSKGKKRYWRSRNLDTVKVLDAELDDRDKEEFKKWLLIQENMENYQLKETKKFDGDIRKIEYFEMGGC